MAIASLVVLLLVPARASAYSVLAHEANVDALWDSTIRPLLAHRFPRATAADIQTARAYAYGGSVIQDLGYYPFGARFFSNLVHYVRSGDFVETLVREARDVNEYAFALGALAHYAADNTGHPEAVNKSVPLLFPKLRQKFGDTITYVQSPSSHVITEFSFDIVQVAAGAYLPDVYHSFIGFEVAEPLLARAFHDVYGLELKDVFGAKGLSISTYRYAVSKLIPELTRAAWRDKKDEIERLTPGVTENAFIYSYTRRQYEREFGTGYQKPGFFVRVLGTLYRVVPKIGPLKPLRFKAPTPEAQALFTASFKDARARYAASLDQVARGRLNLANTDFDTGKRSVHGEYALADDTYAELMKRLSKEDFGGVPAALRSNINAFYAPAPVATLTRKEAKRIQKIQEQLAELNASSR